MKPHTNLIKASRAERKREYRYWIRWARWKKNARSRPWVQRWVMFLQPTEKRNEPFLIIHKRVKSKDGLTSKENTRIPNPDYAPA